MKRYGLKIGIGIGILAVLALVFWWGGNAPDLRGWPVERQQSVVLDASDMPLTEVPKEEQAKPEQQQPDAGKTLSAEEKMALAEQLAEEQATDNNARQQTAEKPAENQGGEPVAEQRPAPVEPEQAAVTSQENTCTLTVRCDTVLQNRNWLNPEKAEIIPADGVIFPEKTVTFYEGESVYNVLLREMKQNKIHMEFTMTPVYNSAYIEGIGNLYEFDCGELSGWMYRVNGWYPNYGSSRYAIKPGDKIEVLYTCDLGADIGGHYAFGKQ